MPITRRKIVPSAGAPVVQPQELSRAQRIGAWAVRGASGFGGSYFANVLGPGTALAFGIGAGGDLLAQAIEENDYNPMHQLDKSSLSRAAIEGGLTAAPGSMFMLPGRVAKTMLRSGVLAGGGEAAREYAKGEKLNPKSILSSGVFGATVGGLLSKFLPKAPTAGTPNPTAGEAAATDIPGLLAGPQLTTEEFASKLPEIMRKSDWKGSFDKIAEEAAKLDAAGKPEFAQAVREAGLRNGYWDEKSVSKEISFLVGQGRNDEAQAFRIAASKTKRGTAGVAEKADLVRQTAAKKAAKEAEDKKTAGTVLDRISDMTEGKIKAARTVKTIDPETGETITVRIPLRTRKTRTPRSPDETLAGGPTGSPEGTPTDINPSGAAPVQTASKMPPAKDGIFQVVAPASGRTWFETSNPDELEAWLTKFGPNAALLKVILPKAAAKSVAPITEAVVKETPEVLLAAKPVETPSTLPVKPVAPPDEAPPAVSVPAPTGPKPTPPSAASQVERNAIAQAEAAAGPPLAPEIPVTTNTATLSRKEQLEHLKEEIENRLKTTGSPRDREALEQNLAAVKDELVKVSVALPTVPSRGAAPISLAPAGPAPADMPLKEALKYYKSTSPVEDLKFLLRNRTDLPDELTTKITTLLQSKKLNKQQVAEIFTEVRAAASAREKASGVPAIGTKAWQEAQDAAKLADEVPVAPPADAPEGVKITNPAAPSTVSAVESQLRTLAAAGNKEATAALQRFVASGDEVAAKETLVTLLGKADATPVVPPVEAPTVLPAEPVLANAPPTIGQPPVTPKAPSPLVDKAGNVIDYRRVLSDREVQETFEQTMRERYAEVNAPQAAEELIAASRAYRTAKADGITGEELKLLGKAVAITIPRRLEAEGIIPAGFARQISDDMRNVLQKAAEDKLGSTSFTDAPPVVAVPSAAQIQAATPPPYTGPDKEPPLFPMPYPEVDVTSIPREPNTFVLADTLPNHLVKRQIALMDAVDKGTLRGTELVNARNQLEREMKAYWDKQGKNAPILTGSGPSPQTPRVSTDAPSTPEGSNGPVLGSGFGALEGLRNNPQMAVKAGMIAGGALLGAATGPTDDPVADMILGGIAGFGGTKALELLRKSHINPAAIPELKGPLETGHGLTETISGFMHLLPSFQRANYLWSAEGLGANAVAGPYGSGFFGALTKGLAGDKRGWAALKELAPWNAKIWIDEYKNSYQQAKELISRVEAGDPRARAELGGSAMHKLLEGDSTAQKMASRYLGFPAWVMAAGDIATKKILLRAGFSEAEAREMTATSEPMIPVFQKLMQLRRGKPSIILEIMLPFIRTPLNLLEQGLMRIPGIGAIAHRIAEKQGKTPASFREKAVQQGMGAAIATTSYMIGLVVPKEQASTWRRYLSNGAGQYSALAAMGFVVGQGAQRSGDNLGWLQKPIAGAVSPEAVRQIGYSFPLPVIEPVSNIVTMAGQLYNGRPLSAPSGLVPQQALDILYKYMKAEPTTSGSIKGIRGIKRRIK